MSDRSEPSPSAVHPAAREAVAAAIRNRRSLRAFAPDPPSDAELAVLFEAARWAPSAGNGQPWRFVLARRGGRGFDALATSLTPRNVWAVQAPILALAAARTMHVHPEKPPKPNRLALLELGLAIGNLLVQASALGIVAHPMAGFDAASAAEAMRVPPDHEVGVVVAIGFPGDPEALPSDIRARDEAARERIPRSAFVYEGAWGEGAEPE